VKKEDPCIIFVESLKKKRKLGMDDWGGPKTQNHWKGDHFLQGRRPERPREPKKNGAGKRTVENCPSSTRKSKKIRSGSNGVNAEGERLPGKVSSIGKQKGPKKKIGGKRGGRQGAALGAGLGTRGAPQAT